MIQRAIPDPNCKNTASKSFQMTEILLTERVSSKTIYQYMSVTGDMTQ